MSEYLELRLDQRNDYTLAGTVIADDDTQAPVDLADVALEMYIKPDAATDDAADGVTILTSQAGEITVGGDTGAYTAQVPGSALAVPGPSWYRVDTISGGKRKTVVRGLLWVAAT